MAEILDSGFGGDVYEVERLLDVRVCKGVTEYLVRWVGWSSEDDSWEPESSIHSPELIARFRRKQKKAKPEPAPQQLKPPPMDTRVLCLTSLVMSGRQTNIQVIGFIRRCFPEKNLRTGESKAAINELVQCNAVIETPAEPPKRLSFNVSSSFRRQAGLAGLKDALHSASACYLACYEAWKIIETKFLRKEELAAAAKAQNLSPSIKPSHQLNTFGTHSRPNHTLHLGIRMLLSGQGHFSVGMGSSWQQHGESRVLEVAEAGAAVDSNRVLKAAGDAVGGSQGTMKVADLPLATSGGAPAYEVPIEGETAIQCTHKRPGTSLVWKAFDRSTNRCTLPHPDASGRVCNAPPQAGSGTSGHLRHLEAEHRDEWLHIKTLSSHSRLPMAPDEATLEPIGAKLLSDGTRISTFISADISVTNGHVELHLSCFACDSTVRSHGRKRGNLQEKSFRKAPSMSSAAHAGYVLQSKHALLAGAPSLKNAITTAGARSCLTSSFDSQFLQPPRRGSKSGGVQQV